MIDVESWEGYSFIEPRFGSKLSTAEVDYWKDLFVKNLKIAYEVEVESVSRSSVSRILEPSGNITGISKYGVCQVKGDGSIPGGTEVTTVGKRVNFYALHEQVSKVIDTLSANGAQITPRCGLHVHLLYSYVEDKTELEKPIPGIIFKNFYNLLKRHLPELVYLTAAINYNRFQAITRYENFCKASNLMVMHNNKTLDEVYRQINSKYSFINPWSVKVQGEELTRLHLEMRYPDSTLSACQIVANGMLLAALMIKAIELSKYGLISTGSDSYWAQTKILYKQIRNDNDMGYSASTTERVSSYPGEDMLDIIGLRAKHLVLSMRQPLRYFDKTVCEILEKMAGYPVYKQLMNHRNYKQIDKYLMPKDERDKPQFVDITKLIDTYQIINCKDKKEWEEKAAVALNATYKTMNNRVWKLSKVRDLTFDRELGAVIFVE